MSNQTVFRVNNFDLLRFAAATQVAIWHGAEHLGLNVPPVLSFLVRLFPGVPIFFFVSGFLISRSYENNPAPGDYFRNRLFRIYPGLIFCNLLSLIALLATGYLSKAGVSPIKVISWFFGQSTIVQFYNPDFLRQFGVGVMNGSLWTITVELQFYLIIPIFYYILGLRKPSTKGTYLLIGSLFGFIVLNQFYQHYHALYTRNIYLKMVGVTFIPWFYMFILGILFQRYFETIHGWVKGKGLSILVIYVLLASLAVKCFNFAMGNGINVLLFFVLACAIAALAYTHPSLSRKLLGGNDVSYGIYIFHMPLVNLFIYYGADRGGFALPLILFATFSVSLLSWFFIERPFLRLKRHALNPLL